MVVWVKTRSEDWLAAGFTILGEAGADELTIERLCRAVDRTKGAFYHHYPDIQAYRAQLLAFWEVLHTQAPIDAADFASVAERRHALHLAVSRLDQKVEVAVRAWAYRDPVAHAALTTVDERRVGYLKQIWHAQGKPKPLAGRLAELEYAAFLGLLARHGPDNRKHKATYTLLIRALDTVVD